MVSASTLIGPFEFDRALATRPLLTCDRAVKLLAQVLHNNRVKLPKDFLGSPNLKGLCYAIIECFGKIFS